MLKVALATHSGDPRLCDGDRILLPEFERAGVDCAIAVWDDVVIKPTVSASAFETWRSSRAAASADEDRFRSLVAARDTLIQRFMPEVMGAGELSLVFIGGHY